MRTSIEKNNPPAGNLLMRWAFKRRDKQLHQYIKHMSAFVTLTHNDAKDWSDITPQARIIPNMLHRYPAEISPDKKTQKRIITAGRLVEQKGYDLLLDTWIRNTLSGFLIYMERVKTKTCYWRNGKIWHWKIPCYFILPLPISIKNTWIATFMS